MEQKGVITDRGVLPRHFEHVVGNRGRHESVWDLKQHLYSERKIEMTPSVKADYGYANCRLESEERLLTAVYMAAFFREGFDEMELHAHCLQGHTLEYVEQFENLTKERTKLKRLMKNSHSA
ncbi:hypothetical protein NM688_g7597 [Phlebia brevispora]|uniref:Uncharacterized protein n=1 Tax=Phlebia brevispora TaxID=194682 RepID=A0ACC1S3F3_9APHY|nr:hypothetical protein NM688_g7597 [Phlebia brevispora]